MKKICYICITFLFMLIIASCDMPSTPSTYTITVINGEFKDEKISVKEANYKDILVIVPSKTTEEFIGWYVGDVLVSKNEEYTFQVEKNMTIEAYYQNASGIKMGYYVLSSKIENGLDLTDIYVFNSLFIKNETAIWYEVDFSGAKEQSGEINIEGNTVSLSIGLRKYEFTANEDFTVLTFDNKINRIPVYMEYHYQKDFNMSTNKGNVNFTDELFGDNIEENFYNYCPSVMIENGTTMHVWYCSNEISGNVTDFVAYRRGTLTEDGKWTFTEKELVLSPTPGTWDQRHVCDPTVVKGSFNYNNEEYSYLMAYLGCKTSNNTCNEVGIAVAKQPNGPFIKIDEINPIANYYKKCEEHGNASNWLGAWGYGQPSLVSIDKAGKIMLFYSAGTANSTHTVAEEWDLSNLNSPVKISSTDLSNVGVTSASGTSDVINNADFAYDPATKRLICVKEDFPYPTNGGTNWIAGSNTLIYLQLDEEETSPMNSIVGTKKTWIQFDAITKGLTGFERNHNAGLVTDEYGWVLSSTKIGVVYTSSLLKDDFLSWSAGGQWPALHTYRIHGVVVDLPK